MPSGEKAKVGTKFTFGNGRLTAEVLEVKEDGNRIVQFFCEGNFYTALEDVGQMPLPPYIKEKLQDKERYQTVYSKELDLLLHRQLVCIYQGNAEAATGKGRRSGICDLACWTRYLSSGKGRKCSGT